MRAVSGRLRVDLAQYRELEAFAAFGSDLDRASQQQLARGARLVELLKQPASSPFPIGQEIVSIWAGTTGKLDDIDVADVRRFETELLEYIGLHKSELFDTLATAKALEDDMVTALEQIVGEFKEQFQATASADATPAVETGPGRGANEGETSAPQAEAQPADNPSDEAEPAGTATTPGATSGE
jgi:F-type H+-transporting ATPase subunit alpha